jgi:hypothetical protein
MAKKISPEKMKAALDEKFLCRDLGKTLTVRQYLIELLATLWSEGESFSGKRPFGNSGWEYDVFVPLIKAGHIPGSVDEDGYVEDVDGASASAFVAALIMSLAQ